MRMAAKTLPSVVFLLVLVRLNLVLGQSQITISDIVTTIDCGSPVITIQGSRFKNNDDADKVDIALQDSSGTASFSETNIALTTVRTSRVEFSLSEPIKFLAKVIEGVSAGTFNQLSVTVHDPDFAASAYTTATKAVSDWSITLNFPSITGITMGAGGKTIWQGLNTWSVTGTNLCSDYTSIKIYGSATDPGTTSCTTPADLDCTLSGSFDASGGTLSIAPSDCSSTLIDRYRTIQLLRTENSVDYVTNDNCGSIYTYNPVSISYAAPNVTGITPASPSYSTTSTTTVTLAGNNFRSTTSETMPTNATLFEFTLGTFGSGTTLTMSGTDAKFGDTLDSIVLVVPAGYGIGPYNLKAKISGNTAAFINTSHSEVAYPAPAVTGWHSSACTKCGTVTFAGSNFGPSSLKDQFAADVSISASYNGGNDTFTCTAGYLSETTVECFSNSFNGYGNSSGLGNVTALDILVTNGGSVVTNTLGAITYKAPTISAHVNDPRTTGGVITITGSNFGCHYVSGDAASSGCGTYDAASYIVMANSLNCTSPNLVSDTSLTCTAAGGNGKNKIIKMTVDYELVSADYSSFQYAAPTITAVNGQTTTQYSPIDGNTAVTFQGINFPTTSSDLTSLSIGGVGYSNAGSCSGDCISNGVTVTSTQIVVTGPPSLTTASRIGGIVPVIISNQDVTGGGTEKLFGYQPPSITLYQPDPSATKSVEGGDTITVSGTNFGMYEGMISMTVGGFATTHASDAVNGSTAFNLVSLGTSRATFVTGAGSCTGCIVRVLIGQTSPAGYDTVESTESHYYTYATPALSSFSPNPLPTASQSVTFAGSNFGVGVTTTATYQYYDSGGTMRLDLGSLNCTVTATTSMKCEHIGGYGSARVRVTIQHSNFAAINLQLTYKAPTLYQKVGTGGGAETSVSDTVHCMVREAGGSCAAGDTACLKASWQQLSSAYTGAGCTVASATTPVTTSAMNGIQPSTARDLTYQSVDLLGVSDLPVITPGTAANSIVSFNSSSIDSAYQPGGTTKVTIRGQNFGITIVNNTGVTSITTDTTKWAYFPTNFAGDFTVASGTSSVQLHTFENCTYIDPMSDSVASTLVADRSEVLVCDIGDYLPSSQTNAAVQYIYTTIGGQVNSVSASPTSTPHVNYYCPKGYTSLTYEGVSCEACALGSNKIFDGALASKGNLADGDCLKCDAGYYQDIANALSCTACSGGTFAATSGSSSCAICGTGTRSSQTSGSSSCVDCAAGTYQDTAGQTTCIDCPAGEYTDAAKQTSCKVCAAGTFATAGSSGCTTCDIGTYSESGAGACTTCPLNTFTRSTGSTQNSECICQAGFWREVTALTACDECIPADACLEASECNTGYAGIRCSDCAGVQFALFGGEKYYKDTETNTCQLCPSTGRFNALIMGIVLVCLAICFMRVAKKGSTFLSRLVTPTLQLIKFFQLIAMTLTMDIGWPSLFGDLFDLPGMSLFSDISVQMSSSECALTMPHYVKFILFQTLPILMIGMYAIILCLCVPLYFKNPKKLVAVVIRSFLLILMILYVPIVANAFSPWDCTKASSGVLYMDSYITYVCYSSTEWWAMAAFSIFGIIAWGIGIPLVFATALGYSYRRPWVLQGGGVFEAMFGFLYTRYEPRTRYWELVEMFFKLALVLSRTFLTTLVLIQLALNFFLLFLNAGIKSIMRPFLRDWEDTVASVVVVGNLIVNGFGLFFFLKKTYPVLDIHPVINIIAMVFFIITIAVVVTFSVGSIFLAPILEKREDKRNAKKALKSELKLKKKLMKKGMWTPSMEKRLQERTHNLLQNGANKSDVYYQATEVDESMLAIPERIVLTNNISQLKNCPTCVPYMQFRITIEEEEDQVKMNKHLHQRLVAQLSNRIGLRLKDVHLANVVRSRSSEGMVNVLFDVHVSKKRFLRLIAHQWNMEFLAVSGKCELPTWPVTNPRVVISDADSLRIDSYLLVFDGDMSYVSSSAKLKNEIRSYLAGVTQIKEEVITVVEAKVRNNKNRCDCIVDFKYRVAGWRLFLLYRLGFIEFSSDNTGGELSTWKCVKMKHQRTVQVRLKNGDDIGTIVPVVDTKTMAEEYSDNSDDDIHAAKDGYQAVSGEEDVEMKSEDEVEVELEEVDSSEEEEMVRQGKGKRKDSVRSEPTLQAGKSEKSLNPDSNGGGEGSSESGSNGKGEGNDENGSVPDGPDIGKAQALSLQERLRGGRSDQSSIDFNPKDRSIFLSGGNNRKMKEKYRVARDDDEAVQPGKEENPFNAAARLPSPGSQAVPAFKKKQEEQRALAERAAQKPKGLMGKTSAVTGNLAGKFKL